MLIDGFNDACKNIADSYLRVGGESMIMIRFWTTAKGKLPHLPYIFRNPKPLGDISIQLPVLLHGPCY